MNRQNVEALAAAIRSYLDAPELEGGSHYIDLGFHDNPGDGGGLDHLAEFLASRGVLAPSVLTVEQIMPIVDGWTPSWEEKDVQAEAMADFIQGLERIAKGAKSDGG